MDAQTIVKAIDELVLSCEVIRKSENCKMCPLSEICLGEHSIVDIADEMTTVLISWMACMAETITERQEEAEKSDYDRKWEAEADYWNLRRCDPDYE